MKAGDVINGYRILEDFRVVGAGLSKWTFAAKDGREYFIKEFLSPTYPDEHAPGSAQTKMRKRQRCQAFERHHRRINQALAEVSGVGGNLIVTEQGIREGVRQVLLPLWNAYSFLTLYAPAKGTWRTDSQHVLDRYILAKLAVLRAALQGDMLWLAIVGIVFAVVGAFYYLRVVKVMYFDEPVGELVPRDDGPLQVAFGVNALALLVLGIFWNPLMSWCQQAFGA